MADLPGRSHWQDVPDGLETVEGDLKDHDFCQRVVRGMKFVLHFAANMGGMGTIHEENEVQIYQENHTMVLNVLRASIAAGATKFLFASSACVYPDFLQQPGKDVSLAEDDVWQTTAPRPQGLYGLEKLCSELVISLGATNFMKTYTVRFHNIYGPHGSWRDGREKAPAALLRKALVAKHTRNLEVEIWGSGTQRRSFCYIDDAVDGVLKLLASECHEPMNIGSEEAVSIDELARMAAAAVGLDPQQLNLRHVEGRPVGVGSRNSNNTRVRECLGWAPEVPLQEGLKRTGRWIEGEFEALLASNGTRERTITIEQLRSSRVVRLRPSEFVFALLLPITSRAGRQPISPRLTCLDSLRAFARSLLDTTTNDVSGKAARFSYRIYLAIDDDDSALWDGQDNHAERVLHGEGIVDVVTLKRNYPRGHVCSLWRDCAREAWKDHCDFFVLVGDDVTLHSPGWMTTIHETFQSMSEETHLPFGLGCVAFKDTTFPGMPTFPVVHRTHMSMFHGQVVPDVVVNQDGDPFLYQLYRRFGCSRMADCEIQNAVGGSDDARYEKTHAKDWTLGTLSEATNVVESYLCRSSALKDSVQYRKLTIDVVVPCYRVMLPYIDAFLALQTSPTCSVMFIIIVDNPASPDIRELKNKYEKRLDVRIRVNQENLGASGSRNRGLQESSAEWVLFLDDDVRPELNLLVELEKRIREFPNAAGFVGNAQFPLATTIFTAALHLAGVTYFWDIASKMPDSVDVPWGVTANLAARRDTRDGVMYDLGFPKTGGGEDIDYCRKKRQFSIDRERLGFVAAPQVTVTHPYWNNGRRSYWRFYNWSKGDGALIKRYPELVYLDSPNSAELLLFSAVTSCLTSGLNILTPKRIWVGSNLLVAVFLANILHDCYRHLYRDADRACAIKTDVTGPRWVLAVLESSLIRMFSEWGRLVGLLERGEWGLLCHRFDWFAGVYGNGPRDEERKNNVQRIGMSILILSILVIL